MREVSSRGLPPILAEEVKMAEDIRTCRHCNEPLSRWANPGQSTWAGEFQWVCFNDRCPYFVRGWIWMERCYSVTASYRYRFDPATGEDGPLPVWSKDALKDEIIRDCEEVPGGTGLPAGPGQPGRAVLTS